MRTVVKPACAHALLLLLASASCTGETEQPASPSAATTLHRSSPKLPDARAAVAWNQLANEIAVAEDQFLTFKGHRALAMMHLAMHDALNTIVPSYRRYAYSGDRIHAHPRVAAAQAAYQVLVSQYPGEQARLDDALAPWLELADGKLRARSIELGNRAAEAVLARRRNDGYDLPGTYEFKSGPGQYQTTPPWDGFVAQPGFAKAKPFALTDLSRFRPPSPPALGSRAYASAFNEVKLYGAVDSRRRSEDQSGYAIWWMEFAEGSVNRLARRLVLERKTDLWTASRLFAHLNVTIYDGYVAVWDSKYRYNHWRPYTAIREAAADGNPGTRPEPDWLPLRVTPPHPEYVSAHAVGCAGSLEVLRRVWGNHIGFTMTTTTAPPGMPRRAFRSFTDAAEECADSRVMLGWHYRYATDAGLRLGRNVADYVAEHLLRPRR